MSIFVFLFDSLKIVEPRTKYLFPHTGPGIFFLNSYLVARDYLNKILGKNVFFKKKLSNFGAPIGTGIY
jgi:hypothetical protein